MYCTSSQTFNIVNQLVFSPLLVLALAGTPESPLLVQVRIQLSSQSTLIRSSTSFPLFPFTRQAIPPDLHPFIGHASYPLTIVSTINQPLSPYFSTCKVYNMLNSPTRAPPDMRCMQGVAKSRMRSPRLHSRQRND